MLGKLARLPPHVLRTHSLKLRPSHLDMLIALKSIRQMMKQDPIAFPADLEEDLDDFSDVPPSVPLRPPYFQQAGSPIATVGRREGDVGARGSRGTIIQIASVHGLIGGPSEPAYCASKGAVVLRTRRTVVYGKHPAHRWRYHRTLIAPPPSERNAAAWVTDWDF
ncbi:hypothetical protein L1887_50891 [Cichorium endivia]|nr:hypothetical protein L1887_50891 [Cichorium endivia]